MKQIILVLLISLGVDGFAIAGEWLSTELCVIGWDGSGYNLFSEMAVNDPGTPEIASDDYIEPTRGPHMAIVDRDENIIVASRGLQQLVGFNSSGKLIFNFSHKSSGYTPDIFEYIPKIIYVDTLSRLYIVTSPPLEYVSVVNYDYEVLEKIRPYPRDRSAVINSLNWASDGTLFFRSPRYGWMTYADGEFSPGGSGDFYAAAMIDCLGLRDRGGLVRIGIAPYNTKAELDRVIEVLAQAS